MQRRSADLRPPGWPLNLKIIAKSNTVPKFRIKTRTGASGVADGFNPEFRLEIPAVSTLGSSLMACILVARVYLVSDEFQTKSVWILFPNYLA